MKIYGFNKHLYQAPEGDESSGSGGTTVTTPPSPPAPPEPPSEKTYTQKEKDADEAKLRRRYDREIKEQKAKIDEMSSMIDELRAKVDRNTNDPSDPVAAGRDEIEQRRRDREFEELRQQIEQTKAVAEQERQKRLTLEKDQLLNDALMSAGVHEKNMLMARRFFMPQIEWDDLDQKWMFRTKNNNLVEISDGVGEELPDNLKPSMLQRGGAGTNGGLPVHQQRKVKALEEAKAKLDQLKAESTKNPANQTAFSAWTRQKRVVQRLESELKNSK